MQSLDKTISSSHIAIRHAQHQVTVNARGQKERVFVDLREVYPTPEEPGTELSFEEVWARKRGWLDRTWPNDTVEAEAALPNENDENSVDLLVEAVSEKLVVQHDVVMLDENGAPIFPHKSKSKKKKAMEVNETQISKLRAPVARCLLANSIAVKAKLDSPSGPKFRKRNASAEPTMTLHTRAAHDDIYDIFNQPIAQKSQEEDSDHHDEYDTDDYTSGAESTCTTRNISTSEAGDEEEVPDDVAEDETSDANSVSEWSEFSARKHVPDALRDDEAEDGPEEEDVDSTQSSDLLDIGDEPAATPEQTPEDDDNEAMTPIMDSFALPVTRTSFVPIPPEDYVAPTRPYRDPVEAANNRLPFMTPITERTETSLDISAEKENDIHAKSPIKLGAVAMAEQSPSLEPLSSPLREVVNEAIPKGRIPQPLLHKPRPALAEKKPQPLGVSTKAVKKGPIINDLQCNPVDDAVRNEILANMHPPLASYDGFFDHRVEKFGAGSDIRKFTKAVKASGRNSVDKTGNLTGTIPPTISFPDSETKYTVKRELGAGAFAPVYLVETFNPQKEDLDDEDDEDLPPVMGKGTYAPAHTKARDRLEALKMEDPPTPWEFYMMRLAHSRLGPHHRATASLTVGLECHLYRDEGFLFLPFHPHGTLLDVVNFFRAEPSGVMDELLAAFFTVELLRTVEALHAKQLLHGDLKPDNCLLRIDPDAVATGAAPLETQYHPGGLGGWDKRGITLIDFGRGIDMRAFRPEVQFIADWKTGPQDCAEMREGRPWTWQIDYHGLASVVHCLLFGKYIETVRVDSGGLGTVGVRKYRIRESLKRYWQTEMWGEVFDLCLNPGSYVEAEEGGKMPVLKGMRRVRERVEGWLEETCERGVGLKALVGKVEAWALKRK
jgi:checkpoint serine/threonine-protein kinase